jgi:hypothetical protein
VLLGVCMVPASSAGARSPAGGVERPSFVYSPDGAKRLPLRVPGSRAVKGTGGAIAQIIELRGWLTFVGPRCYSEPRSVPIAKLNKREPDWHYNLELDPTWLDHLGVKDPNLIVRPGNVINSATRVARPGDVDGHETGALATPSDLASRLARSSTSRSPRGTRCVTWDSRRQAGGRMRCLAAHPMFVGPTTHATPSARRRR